MRIFRGFDMLPALRRPVVTVGSFDGVHAGHRRLLDVVVSTARERGGESVVVTFDPHPRDVLEGAGTVGLLTSLPEKALLLERAGIDNLIVVPFTREFSRLSYGEFVERLLVGCAGMATLVVGYNHRLGRDKAGDFEALEQLAARLGFDIAMVARHDVGGYNGKVSSTVVRGLIADGQLGRAADYLGYDYFITGRAGDGGVFVPAGGSKLLPPAGEYRVAVGLSGGAHVEKWDGILTIAPDGTLTLSCPKTQAGCKATAVDTAAAPNRPTPPTNEDLTVEFV